MRGNESRGRTRRAWLSAGLRLLTVGLRPELEGLLERFAGAGLRQVERRGAPTLLGEELHDGGLEGPALGGDALTDRGLWVEVEHEVGHLVGQALQLGHLRVGGGEVGDLHPVSLDAGRQLANEALLAGSLGGADVAVVATAGALGVGLLASLGSTTTSVVLRRGEDLGLVLAAGLLLVGHSSSLSVGCGVYMM